MSSKLNDTQLVLLSAASQPYEAWETPNEARVSDWVKARLADPAIMQRGPGNGILRAETGGLVSLPIDGGYTCR